MLKRFFFIFILFVLPLTLLNMKMVFAQTATTAPTISATSSPVKLNRDNLKAENQETRLTNLKTRANLEIDRRVTSLSKLLTRLNSLKRLSPTQITSFTSQIQAEITSLANLKTKIAADTDLATLQTDVKSIVLSYRVYALFMPQLSIISAGDRALELVTKLTAIVTKVQDRITKEKTKGNDVTALETALTDLQAKIVDAQKQATDAISEVTPLLPEGYPGNKTVLLDAHSKIKLAHTELQTASQDLKTIINGLKSFQKPRSTEPTVVASPTASLTTTP